MGAKNSAGSVWHLYFYGLPHTHHWGFVADRYLGSRKTVLLGAFIMALGHASMALETPAFLYIGLLCLIFGNGFFKPNMTSIVSQLYKDHAEKKMLRIRSFIWVSTLVPSWV